MGHKSSEFNRRSTQREQRVGVNRISDPHCLDVEAQIIEMRSLRREWLDPRLQILRDDERLLLQQNALIFNIDYPLGMAAYHVFSQVSTGWISLWASTFLARRRH